MKRNDHVEKIEPLKTMKDIIWKPELKEYYEPSDVLRYFDEQEYARRQSFTYGKKIKLIEPENFFKKEILEKGLKLLKNRKLTELKNKLNYLKEIEIPELEKEILRTEQM